MLSYTPITMSPELLEAIDYVHLHGKKIYLTVNTLLKNREIEQELYDYLESISINVVIDDEGNISQAE